MQKAKCHLRHVTLTTGHARDSYRSEVSDEAVAVCRELIARFTGGEAASAVPMPGLPGYSISGRASAKCLVATVWADGPPSVPVVSIGVATHSRCGSRLWHDLHRWGRVPVVTDPERPPAEPWVAAALDEGAAYAGREIMMLLGDFERCLGWAFIVDHT